MDLQRLRIILIRLMTDYGTQSGEAGRRSVDDRVTSLPSGAVLTLFFVWQQDLLANIVAHAATDVLGLLRASIRLRKSGSAVENERGRSA
jgi:hypothetical protein